MNEALCKTIQDLQRFVDAHPENVEAREELSRLERERRVRVDDVLESQAVEVSQYANAQVVQEGSFASLSAQYRGACALYRSLMELVARNRALKASLRAEMAKRKGVRV